MLTTTNHQVESSPTIRLKTAAIKDAVESRGWGTYREIAQGVGTSPATAHRLFSATQAPGRAFIAAVLLQFPDRAFEDFFEVVGPEACEEAA